MNKFKQKFTACIENNDVLSTVLTALIIAAVVFVNIIIYTLANTFGWYFTPEEKTDFSISNSGDALFAEAREKGLKVDITFCMYEDDFISLQKDAPGYYVYRTAKEFEERYPDLITLNYVNAITMLDSENKPVDLSVYEKDMRGKETPINKHSVIFKSESSYYVLTDTLTLDGYADFFTFDESSNLTSYEGEEMFASLISWVLKDKHGTAYLTTGHGETASIYLRNTLVKAGYYCDPISDIANLRSGEVPEDADLLIISNPKSDFERAAEGSSVRSEIEHLKSYTERGGDLMVFLDSEADSLPVLEKFLSEFGIGIMDNSEGERLTVKDSSNAITVDGFTLAASYNNESDTAKKMFEKTEHLGGKIIIKNASPLSLSGNASAILLSSPSSVAEAGGETVDREGGYALAACSTKKNTGAADSKLFVVSSIYLTATDAMITDGYSNRDFLYSLFDVYFEKGAMPYGCNNIVFDSGMLENLTMGTAKILTAVLLAIPVVLTVVGTAVTVRRKNR